MKYEPLKGKVYHIHEKGINIFLYSSVKSAVQGLLEEIEKIKESLNESIKQAEREDDRCAKYDFWFALDIVKQIDEKIKKWFADVINKEAEK